MDEKLAFKKVATFSYSSEAYICKGKLESEGIEVFMRDNFTIDTDPLVSNVIGGVKLFVKEEDYENAIQILEEINKYSLTNDGKPVECPNCGAAKVQMFSVVNDAKSMFSFVVGLLLTLLPFYVKYRYKCENCNFEFKKT